MDNERNGTQWSHCYYNETIAFFYNRSGKDLAKDWNSDGNLVMGLGVSVSIFIMLANLLVMIAIFVNQRFHFPIYYLIANLAAADFFAGLAYFLIFYTGPNPRRLTVWTWLLHQGLFETSLTASVANLLAIAIERHITVRRMQLYTRMGNGRVLVLIVLIWTMSIVMGFMPSAGWNCICSLDSCSTVVPLYSNSYLVFWAVFSLVTFVVMVTLYAHIFMYVRKRTNPYISSGVRDQDTTMPLLKTVVIILGSFIVCWTPGLVLLLLDVFCTSCNVLTFEKSFLLLAVFNSAMNPIIYSCRFQEMRATFRRILCCECQENVQGMAVEGSQTAMEGKKGQDMTVDINAIMDKITIVIYTITVFLGVTGNSIVIWVASFKLKPSVNNVWLVNLAVADLIFCFTRVLSLVKKLFFNHLPISMLVCKFNGYFKYANMFCSVFLLAVISIDRALCVWFPVFTKNRRTLRAARVASACVWLLASVLSAPYFYYREVYVGKNNATKCSLEGKDSNHTNDKAATLALNIIRFSCGFLLPFVVILVCYILTGIGIRRTSLSKKSRPLRILASLVIAFFLCWAPYHCFQLVKMFDRKSLVVKIGLPVAKAFAYFNSCVNPLLYFCMGLDVKERQSLAGVFRRALAEDEDRTSTQSHAGTLDDSCSETQANT